MHGRSIIALEGGISTKTAAVSIMGTLISVVIITGGLLALAWIGLIVILLLASLYYCLLKGAPLQRELGFRTGTACLTASSFMGYIKALRIEEIADDGVFERAGFRVGDVLPDYSEIGLFQLLDRSRGRTIAIKVVNGGLGPPYVKRQRRIIQLTVPAVAGSGLDCESRRS